MLNYSHHATQNQPAINYDYSFSALPFKLFIQPNFGYQNPKFEFALSTKLLMINQCR